MKILYITNSFPKYFYRFASMPIAEEVNQFIKDRNIFIRNVHNHKNLYIRMYHTDFGRNEKEMLAGFTELKFYNKKNINYKKFDLVVVDHPITSMLECFAEDVPTLMFWNRSLWRGNEKFECYLNKFYSQVIFFLDPRSVSNVINKWQKVEFDIKKWWEERDRNLINDFKREFTSTKQEMLNKILKEVE